MNLRRWGQFSSPLVISLTVYFIASMACKPAPVHEAMDETNMENERARLIQCCQGLVHEAWNSDPPNANVLHAARKCEQLAREDRLEEAREHLRSSGHAATCELCPLFGCRPRKP